MSVSLEAVYRIHARLASRGMAGTEAYLDSSFCRISRSTNDQNYIPWYMEDLHPLFKRGSCDLAGTGGDTHCHQLLSAGLAQDLNSSAFMNG